MANIEEENGSVKLRGLQGPSTSNEEGLAPSALAFVV
jgi:hypothetical protein